MMHGRHRSPGNGYRSASVGMALGASRISMNSSIRGRSFYNSEYRSFNNWGFGRGQGQPKSFHHASQPLQRKGDILMEARRLAAEYLVSKGLVVPQSTFPGKSQNVDFKMHVGDYQDFRLQEDVVKEGRISAHTRRSSAPDVGVGRRRYSDNFNSRNHGKEGGEGSTITGIIVQNGAENMGGVGLGQIEVGYLQTMRGRVTLPLEILKSGKLLKILVIEY